MAGLPMLGFKTFRCARILLGGIENMHMIKKGQMKSTKQISNPDHIAFFAIPSLL
jgi:putative transposase